MSKIASVTPTLLILSGFTVLLLGIGWVSRPAALIVGGGWLIASGLTYAYLKGRTA